MDAPSALLRRRSWPALVAALAVLVVFAAACGPASDGILSGRPLLERDGRFDGRTSVALDVESRAGLRYVARLVQRDADLELAVLATDGRTLVRVAGPARAAGREYAFFVAPGDGAVRIEIRTRGHPAKDSGYALQLFQVRDAVPAEVVDALARLSRATAVAASGAATPRAAPDPADVAVELQRVERAVRSYDRLLAADVQLQIAALDYWHRDAWPEAIERAGEARATYRDANDREGVADATMLSALARIELAREQRGAAGAVAEASLRAAEQDFDAAREIYVAERRPVAAAMTRVYSGSGRYYGYDLAGAIERFTQGERELAAAGAQDERTVALGNLATTRADRGDYAGAARDYDRLLPLLHAASGDAADEVLASTLINSGATLLFLGDTERALARYVEALAIADRTANVRARLQALSGLGVSHLYLGQPDVATTHLEAAVELLKNGDRHARVIALLRLGDAYRQQRLYARADAAQAEALRLSENLESAPLRARVAVARGDGYAAARRYDLAIRTYSAALALPLPETHGVVARALVGRARAYRLAGAVADARADLDRAVELTAASGDRGERIAATYEQAELAAQTGDSARALELATRAVAGIRTLTAEMTNPDNRATLASRLRGAHELRVGLLAADAQRLRAADDPRAAEARAVEALLAADEANPLARVTTDPRRAELAEQTRVASALAERRYRLETLAERNATATPTMRAIDREIAVLRSQLTRLGDAPAPPPRRDVTATSLRARVPAGSVLLVYSLGADRSWRWTVTRGRFELDALPGAAAIDRQVEALLDAARSPASPAAALVAARSLAATLVPHDVGAGERWLVVPDGSLGAVPWSMLGGAPSPATAIQLPSVAAMLEPPLGAWTSRPLRLALYGDPIFGSDDPRLPASARSALAPAERPLPRLPGTARELAAIAALAPAGDVRLATGADATRDAVLALPRGGTDVLHLATHATLDAEVPALAALVLSRRDASGRPLFADLRAPEIVGLAAHPRLVVLSACDAAAEPSRSARGLMNLTRAFLAGGSRYVVASRWAVADASAVALMTEFYRALLVDGLAPDAALARAQRTLAASPQWRAPFHWAGFVVTGAAP